MKLVRYGAIGQEKPGLIDKSGHLRDLSSRIGDLNGETYSPASSTHRLTARTRFSQNVWKSVPYSAAGNVASAKNPLPSRHKASLVPCPAPISMAALNPFIPMPVTST